MVLSNDGCDPEVALTTTSDAVSLGETIKGKIKLECYSHSQSVTLSPQLVVRILRTQPIASNEKTLLRKEAEALVYCADASAPLKSMRLGIARGGRLYPEPGRTRILAVIVGP